jgi:hypothetical protein
MMLLFLVLIPVIIQNAIRAGGMQFDHIRMVDPVGMTVVLAANGTLSNVNTHGWSGSILPATVKVVFHRCNNQWIATLMLFDYSYK